MGTNFFIPHFFYLSQNGVSEQSKLTTFCSDKVNFKAVGTGTVGVEVAEVQ